MTAGPSMAKSPRIENRTLESLRPSLTEEITSVIKSLLLESQREMLRILKLETKKNVREQGENAPENETREFQLDQLESTTP